jgi:7-carboxy-7-deazaguanine synthase (Cx14CxxC type)
MSYAVKEIFYTLQGEGAQSGRAAVFCRFAGCNLWSGREQDRESAICKFCDTDFADTNGPGGGRFGTPEELAAAIQEKWPSGSAPAKRMVVCTGGEPLLQLDAPLIEALHACNFEIAVETNGTIVAPELLDWICVSPKAGAPLRQTSGSELKMVYPQTGVDPEDFIQLQFNHFFLQPMDGPNLAANTELAVQYCLKHPLWRLSLQTHKIVGIP